VHRHNGAGLAGRADRPHPSPAPRLAFEQPAELMRLVADGPDPETDGVERWRPRAPRDQRYAWACLFGAVCPGRAAPGWCRSPGARGSGAPEPVGNVWEYLRQNRLSLRVRPDGEAIVATWRQAWNGLMAMPERVASITRREWAKPVTG
jgi:hypothetical protein